MPVNRFLHFTGARLRMPNMHAPARIVVVLFLAGVLVPVGSAYAQPDTTEAVPPDTLEDQTDTELQPLSFSPALFGRAQTDSMPGRLPQVSLDHILAQQPGSFLYDLGTVGWPHGWSPRGFAPHRTHLWLDGQSYDDPLTSRPQFELLPPSFLDPPRTGIDPGGGPVGVSTGWRAYDRERPLTELRYRVGDGGLHAIEVGHSQKRRLSLSGTPGALQITVGYGGRKVDGTYDGSQLRRERRIWGRLRYQTNDWTVELTDRASRHRVGAHGGVVPPRTAFTSIYLLPLASASVNDPGTWRRTARNDLTARLRAPILPSWSAPLEASATWTSHTFDYHPHSETGFSSSDTTWTVKLNGGHARLRQPVSLGAHHLTLSARGALWSVAQSNAPQIDGTRGALHALLRDSLRVDQTQLILDVGGHLTSEHQYPSAAVRATRPTGPFRLVASVSLANQRPSWIAEEGFVSVVQPASSSPSGDGGRVLEGTVEGAAEIGPVDATLEGFAHQLRNAVDLFAAFPDSVDRPTTITDSVVARQLPTPIRRVGATVSLGWRRDTDRGLYAAAQGTALHTLGGTSALNTRLARTLPTFYGRGRIGARFVLFQDLITDLYVQARGWSAMNSRWFHPPTGRFSVPPPETPIPATPNRRVGPSGTIDVHAEARIRGATLFFTFENVQASSAQPGTFRQRASLHPGTFVVPVYPLPARQFRFGVFWPIFD